MAQRTADNSRASRRKSIKGVDISPEERVNLYAQSRYLSSEFSRKSGLFLPFVTYFQDPFLTKQRPQDGLDLKTFAAWEPGLTDGPTSARFAVVDYNADTEKLEVPALWYEKQQIFIDNDGLVLDQRATKSFQFHQVNVWALLQRALSFFENGNALGRTIPWAFEGNRLIVVPHAGYGQNAYYDRASKSLQFYYFFDDDGETVYTCLSTDIVSHEFAHAVLDGVRPLYNESSSLQTAAFHEFIGDLSAILLTLRNNSLRRREADASKGKVEKAKSISSIAEEFGRAALGKPYLRTARNKRKMSELKNRMTPHDASEVLTGAMFDVLIQLAKHYREEPQDQPEPATEPMAKTPRQVFWRAADRMQRMAIQPLDLLPPVEVTFRDYALAVCRSHQLSDPIDPHKYLDLLIEVFRKRQILSKADAVRLKEPGYLHSRLELSVHHSLDDISRSRAAAYRFLDDNREDLLIPANRDFLIADLYDAKKRSRQNVPLPRQIILQYVWREEVSLSGPQFGKFDGSVTTMLCGGTLVFDDYGNVLSWAMKPGSLPYAGKRKRGGRTSDKWAGAVVEGSERKQMLLDNLARQIAAGSVGSVAGTGKGLLGTQVPPMIVEDDGGLLKFRLTPHLHLSSETSDEHQQENTGDRQWEISC